MPLPTRTTGACVLAAPLYRATMKRSGSCEPCATAKKAPMLLCYEGAGCNFRGLHDRFREVVGDGPYIVVTPITFSNANELVVEKYKPYYPSEVWTPFAGANVPDELSQRLK